VIFRAVASLDSCVEDLFEGHGCWVLLVLLLLTSVGGGGSCLAGAETASGGGDNCGGDDATTVGPTVTGPTLLIGAVVRALLCW